MNNNDNNLNTLNNNENTTIQQSVNTANNNNIPPQEPKKNKLGIILLVLGILLIVAGMASSFLLPEEPSKQNNNSNETTNNNNSNDNNNNDTNNIINGYKPEILTEYNGMLQKDANVPITDTFNITIPEEFVSSTSDIKYISKELETDGSGIFNSCSIELSQIVNFDNAETLASSMAKYHSADNTSTTKEINGITWHNFQYDLIGTKDIYITEKEGKIYMLEYTTEKDANQETCKQHKDNILNSISYK